MNPPTTFRTKGTSLHSRLILAFASLILLLGIVGGSSVAALELSTRSMQVVVHSITPAMDIQRTNSQSLRELRADAQLVAATGDRSALRDLPQRRARIIQGLGRLPGINHHPELADLADAEAGMTIDWLDELAELADGTTPTVPVTGFNEAMAANAATTLWLERDRQRLRDEAAWYRRGSLLVIGLATLLAVIIAVTVATRTITWFVRPLREAVGGLDRLRSGDLTTRLKPKGPREVRMVGSAVNHLADQTALLRALREESARLRRGTIDGALAVREKLEWDEVVDAGLRAMSRTLDVDAVWFHPVEDMTVRPCSGYWAAPTFDAVVDVTAVIERYGIRLEVNELRDLWTDGLAHVVTGVSWVPDEIGLVEGGSAAFGPGTVITVPLVGGEELMGCTVLLDTRGPRNLSSEEVAALLVMASNTAVGLQHSRVFGAQRDLVERLQDLDRQKTAFLSNVSHELRTPLTSIAGYTEMLADGDGGELSPPMVPMLEAIERNTKRLSLLIDDLLAISRIESAAYRIVATRIPVADLVDQAVEAVAPTVANAGLTLVVDRGEGLAVTGDNTQLERCLLNLLSNAIKFTPAGGTVMVSVTRHAGPDARNSFVHVTVSDTGIGIPAADLKNLFTRFFRASNAVDQEIPGTGLGLAIVRGILEHHGGTLEVESEEGVGTTVRLVLPEAVGEVLSESEIPTQRVRRSITAD